MESESKIAQLIEKFREWIAEQEWFQQLKTKWDELDPQSQMYARLGALGGGVVIFLLVILSSIWSVQSLKSELQGKQELLDLLQSSSDELSRLKGESMGLGEGNEKPNWPAFVADKATRAGIDGGSVDVSAEKPGASQGDTRESLFDIQIKHVSIKQVVRFAFNLETAEKPVKLKTLAIDTKADPEGYMDAILSVSAFSTAEEQKTGGKH
jgi:hypothetical protein